MTKKQLEAKVKVLEFDLKELEDILAWHHDDPCPHCGKAASDS